LRINKYAELKNSIFPDSAQKDLQAQGGWKFFYYPGTGRRYAELRIRRMK